MDKVVESVLLVDDEARDLEILGEVLEQHGYAVVRAGNAAEAMLRVCRFPNGPDLLVADVSLPDVNGIELHRQLSNRFGSRLGVLFISAYSGAELLRFHGITLSDIHFLAKPFSAADLLHRVEMLLSNPVPLSIAS